MDQDQVATASAEDEERAKVRKAQGVMERTSASVGQVCLIILTLLAIFYTLYFAAGIILPFVLALVLTMVLGPAMRLMNRRLHIPRVIAALLLIIALFGAVGASGYALSVPASAWIAKAPQSLPALMDKLSFLRRPIQLIEQGVEPRSRHEFVAAFVSAATASHRAPAVRQCSSPDEARHWVEREAAALGHVPVEWVSEPLSHR